MIICEHSKGGCKSLTFCGLSLHFCFWQAHKSAFGLGATGGGGRKRRELLVFFLHLRGVGDCSVVSAAEVSLTQGHAKHYLLHFAVSLTDVEWELGLMK